MFSRPNADERYAVILPVGPGEIATVLDTIESILFYSGAETTLFIVDDHTTDGTYERLEELTDPRIVLVRNARPFGYDGLHVTVAKGFRECVRRGPFAAILRIDSDALVTGPGICASASRFFRRNPHVGVCGRHMINYDGTSKTYRMHTKSMHEVTGFPPGDDRAEGGIGWICDRALRNGWGFGENILGAAYFFRFECVERMIAEGFFDNIESPKFWVIEDVFFTMCALAAGFDRAHFAAPVAPLALAYRALPAPAAELKAAGMKILHSVDKGRWTTAEENGGLTPREYFRQFRTNGDGETRLQRGDMVPAAIPYRHEQPDDGVVTRVLIRLAQWTLQRGKRGYRRNAARKH